MRGKSMDREDRGEERDNNAICMKTSQRGSFLCMLTEFRKMKVAECG